MKRMILVAVLIAASEAQAQDAGSNSSKQPKSENVFTTKDEGKDRARATPAHQGVRPAPSVPLPSPPSKGKNKSRKD
jgi:hypothetical protein